jgi:hypothetical protein
MVDPVAQQPAAVQTTDVRPAIKPATPELVALGSETLPIDYMTDMLFEDIGGQELINISRSDTIDGLDILYQPIKNIASILFQYNPQNILKLQDTSASYFRNFPIHLENKIPECGTGPDCNIVYVDPETGNIIINVINLDKNEQVEVQIMNKGAILDDTMYVVN